jgi:glucose-fructose oxidoreductase
MKDSMGKTWRIAGISFEHFHMGDLLLEVHRHPSAEIAGICDENPERMRETVKRLGIPEDSVFTDYRVCLEQTRPDCVILCPSTGDHALWTERVAEYKLPVLIEKPFAASLEDADRMIAAMRVAGQPLAINWPLRWYRSHAAAYNVIAEGLIGEPIEVHYYDGNRGPLWHGAEKIEQEPTPARKAASWFYKKDAGGGSLLDYLGYGTTLGTWYLGGRTPIDVTAVTAQSEGLEVDEHSVTVARYAFGLSKFETRWGTFTDPWTHQPLPKCGFVIRGSDGAVSSYDYETSVRVQTRERPEGYDLPAGPLEPPNDGAVYYFLHRLESGQPIEGPLSPGLSRIGQQIFDTALRSAQSGRTLPLIGS